MLERLKSAIAAGRSDDLDRIAEEAGARNDARAAFAAACCHLLRGRRRKADAAIEAMLARNIDFLISDWFAETVLPHLSWSDAMERQHPWLRLQFAQAALRAGDNPRVTRLIGPWLDRHAPAADPVGARLTELYFEAVLRPAALDTLGGWLARELDRFDPGATGPVEALYRGCLAFWSGDAGRAARHFARLAGADLPLSPASRGVHTFRPDLAASTCPGLGEMRLDRAARARAPTFVFCADTRYLDDFAPVICRSALRHAGNATLHFHLVGAPEALADATHAALATLPAGRLGLSWEPDPGLPRAYYASARFIRAAELADLYGGWLVFSDIDAAFTARAGAFSAVLDAAGQNGAERFVLRKTRDCHMPWRSTTANLIALRTTPANAALAERMRRLLLGLFAAAADRPTWWCDQSALAIALAEDAARGGPPAGSLFDLRARLKGLPLDYALNHSARKTAFIAAKLAAMAEA